jgi:serine/threonine-protein kinase
MFGLYRLDELLGRGGMGEVWHAYDTLREREVALKRLLAGFAEDEEFRKRFERESKIVARLNEPHIIPIHDFGEIGGRLYLTMRLVEGPDLASLLTRTGSLPAARAVGILEQVARALDAAHGVGLVHRDIKPANVLLTGEVADFAYLADFGIARTSTATSLTATGATIGTFDYIAPERLLRGTCDHRSDIYALGCLLYETLTGQIPFPAEGVEAQMYHHVHTPPPRPSALRPELQTTFDAVIAQAMAKSPESRYGSAGALAAAAHMVVAISSLAPAVPAISRATPTEPAIAAESAPDHRAAPVTSHNDASPTQASAPGPWEPTLVDGANRANAAPTHIRRPALSTNGRRPRRGQALVVATLAVAALAAGALYAARHNSTPQADRPSAHQRATANTVIATIPIGKRPQAVAVSRDGHRAYVLNDLPSVSVIDTDSDTVTATVPVGAWPVAMALSPDGRHVYVVDHGSAIGPDSTAALGSVSVIDTDSKTVTATIPVGLGPIAVALSPNGRRAYVTNYDSGSVSVIDTSSDTAVATISGNGKYGSAMLRALSADGRRGYITQEDNSVEVIDTSTNTVAAKIPVGELPIEVALSPDGRRAYVTNYGSSSVSVIDTGSNTVSATIPVGVAPGTVAVSPDGQRAYVGQGVPGSVSVINLASNTVAATIPVGGEGVGVAVSPDGRRAYTIGGRGDAVSVIDTGSNTIHATIPVGHNPLSPVLSPDGRRAYVAVSDTSSVSVIDTGIR